MTRAEMEVQDSDFLPKLCRNSESGKGLWDTGTRKGEKQFSPSSFHPPQSCCPKGAKRNSGIMSSTWLWATTGSR